MYGPGDEDKPWKKPGWTPGGGGTKPPSAAMPGVLSTDPQKPWASPGWTPGGGLARERTDFDPAGPARQPFATPRTFATDRSTGVPLSVRAALAAVKDPATRLAYARQLLGTDVTGTPDGLAYLNPKTGEWTLINEESVRPGAIGKDIVEALPVIGQGVGAFAGGVAGGGPMTPSGFGGAVLGGAMGEKVGQMATTGLAQALGAAPAPGDPRGVVRGAAEDVAASGIAESIGAIPGGAAAIMRPGAGRVAARADDFARTGVPASVGQLSGSPGLQGIESGLQGLPGGVTPGRRMAERQVDAAAGSLAENLRRVAGVESVGDVASRETLGTVAREEATRIGREFSSEVGRRRDAIFTQIAQSGAVVDGRIPYLNNLAAKRGELARRLESASSVQERESLQGAIEYADGILGGMNRVGPDGQPQRYGIDPLELSRRRTELDGMVEYRPNQPTNPAEAGLKEVRAAIDADIKTYADIAGASKAQAELDAFVRNWRNPLAGGPAAVNAGGDFWDDIARTTDPNQAFDKLVTRVRQSPAKAREIKARLTPEAYQQFAARFIADMGVPNPSVGGPFSLAKFVTSWNSIEPSVRRTIFGEAHNDLERLARVLGTIKDAEKMLNTSRTAHGVMVGTAGAEAVRTGADRLLDVGRAALSPGGAATVSAGALAQVALGPAASIATVLATPSIVTRVLLSPTGAKYFTGLARILARPPTAGTAQQITSQLGRMAAWAGDDPDRRAAVDEITRLLRQENVLNVPTVEF